MIRAFRAEMVRLLRPGPILGGGGAIVAAAVLLSALILSVVPDEPQEPLAGGEPIPPLSAFEGPDGMLAGLGIAVSAMGIAALVLGALSVTTEYGTGALRSLLVAHPRRIPLLGGKAGAVLVFVAAWVVAAALAESCTAALIMEIRDGDTSAWWTADAMVDSLATLGRVVGAMWGWALIGIMLAALLRHSAAAIGIGVAYAMVVEAIIGLAWRDGIPYFPGSVMNAFAAGGVDAYPLWVGGLLLLGYGALFLAVAAVVFQRRDVTV